MQYKYTLVVRKDTGANWRVSNYIPLEGEPCYDIDDKVLKIGDGINKFVDLLLSINTPIINQSIRVVNTLPDAGIDQFSKILKLIGNGLFLCSSNKEIPIINSDCFWVEI